MATCIRLIAALKLTITIPVSRLDVSLINTLFIHFLVLPADIYFLLEPLPLIAKNRQPVSDDRRLDTSAKTRKRGFSCFVGKGRYDFYLKKKEIVFMINVNNFAILEDLHR